MASIGAKGDPRDNASADKNELVKRRACVTGDRARLAIFRHSESFYNPRFGE
jgi:hypothetical protein